MEPWYSSPLMHRIGQGVLQCRADSAQQQVGVHCRAGKELQGAAGLGCSLTFRSAQEENVQANHVMVDCRS